jgi:DNA polymerase III alpha subunit
MNISEYDTIAKDLDNYRENEIWKSIIEESKHFVGVVESMSESPCSMLLYDKSVAEEIGLIRIQDKFCCLLDGYNCDKYKYLKNDYLQVKVWAIIKDVCDMVGIEIPTIQELECLLDNKVWDIYEKGLTCTINQADSDWATSLVKKYKPRSISEGSQWVAIIRPGCASLLNDFLDRKEYTTGVKELDDLLEDSGHRLIYQESIMKYLIWLGISEPHSYDIIKKIAKKKFKEKELDELKGQLREGWMKQVGTIDGFEATWIVVEQASKYSFNASHSLSYFYDSAYGAYLKSHYPLEYYSVVLNYYSDDSDRTTKLVKELDYFNIKIENPKFRYSKGTYMPDKETNVIYKGVGSIKYLNEACANQLYELRSNTYNTFLELLKDINEKVNINSRQLTALIYLDYFSEFGKSKKLLEIYNRYTDLSSRKQFKKSDLVTMGLTEEIMKKYSKKETEKIFKDVDINGLINELIINIEDKNVPLKDKISAEIEYLGYPITKLKTKGFYYVIKIDEFNNKKSITRYLTMYDLYTDDLIKYKLSDFRLFVENPIIENQLIKIIEESKKPKRHKDDNNKWQVIPNEYNLCMDAWECY